MIKDFFFCTVGDWTAENFFREAVEKLFVFHQRKMALSPAFANLGFLFQAKQVSANAEQQQKSSPILQPWGRRIGFRQRKCQNTGKKA
jgi:hypothetical protein